MTLLLMFVFYGLVGFLGYRLGRWYGEMDTDRGKGRDG